MSHRIKSLQLRLTIELAALFFVASCLAVGGLIYSASLTAGSVADRELGLRAEDLARYVSLDENQNPRLELPPTVKQAYTAAAQQSVFAIRDKDGQLVEASTPELGAMIARWPQAGSEPSYFRLSNFGPLGRDYSGVSIKLDSAAGPLSVLIAEASGGDQLVHSILREFVFDIAWYVCRRSLRLPYCLPRTAFAEACCLCGRHRPKRAPSGRDRSRCGCPRPMCLPKRCRSSSRSIVRLIGSTKGSRPSAGSPPMRRMNCERR